MNNIFITFKMKWFPIAIVCILFAHCTGYDEYKKYMTDGEIIYPQKADAVTTYPGKNRIQLEWVIVDPKVTSCKVYYEQEGGIQGDITVAIPSFGNRENDIIRVIIPDLEEATYLFKIISYDDFGNASVPVDAEEKSYGESYEQSLLNCAVRSTTFDFDTNILTIEWGSIDATAIGINLEYIDTNGDSQTLLVDPSESITTILDFKLGEPFFSSAIYKPAPSALDIFSTDWQRINIVLIRNVVLNKPATASATPLAAYPPSNAVDGDRTSTSSRWISEGPFTSPELSPPQWLEIDLQGFYPISEFRMWRDPIGGLASSQSFSLQAWIENDWVDVVTETNYVLQEYIIEFMSVITNKVRLYIRPTVYGDYMIRLYEIEVYSIVRY